MALYYSKSACLCPLTLKLIHPRLCRSFLHRNVKNDSEVLDKFTSELIQKKSAKWANRKSMAQKLLTHNVRAQKKIATSKNSIKNLDSESINGMLQEAIDYDDFNMIIQLTNECIEYEKVPSLSTLLQALSVCSRFGSKETITQICQLCEKNRPEVLEENANFQHYMAEAVWVKGDVIQSLKMFEKIYTENVYLRRKIRSLLKYLILDSITNHSEAIIINLLHFSERLVKEYNDYFPLGCLWYACIMSEWFTDQQLALELLCKHKELAGKVVNKLPFVVQFHLRNHRTEVVYRLNETLLKLNEEIEIKQIVLALIDYWIQNGDLKQAREIILWSVEHNLRIPTIHGNQKLVGLLIKNVSGDFRKKLQREATKEAAPSDYKF